MEHLPIPARDNVPEASKSILDAVHKALDIVPDTFRPFVTSLAALTGLTSLDAANAKALDIKPRTGTALAVARVNRCGYCLSAHTYVGNNLAKISPEEAQLTQQGNSNSDNLAAAVYLPPRWPRPAVKSAMRVWPTLTGRASAMPSSLSPSASPPRT